MKTENTLIEKIKDIYKQYGKNLEEDKIKTILNAQEKNNQFKIYSTRSAKINEDAKIVTNIYKNQNNSKENNLERIKYQVSLKEKFLELNLLVDIYKNKNYNAGILNKIPAISKRKKYNDFLEISRKVNQLSYK